LNYKTVFGFWAQKAKPQAGIFFGLFAALFGVLIFSLSGEVGALIFLSAGRYLPDCAEPIQTECELCFRRGFPAVLLSAQNVNSVIKENLPGVGTHQTPS